MQTLNKFKKVSNFSKIFTAKIKALFELRSEQRKDIFWSFVTFPKGITEYTSVGRNRRNEKWSIWESPAVLTDHERNPKNVNFMRQSWMGERRRYVSLGPIMTGSVQLYYKNKEPNRENRLESQLVFFVCCFLLRENLSSSFLKEVKNETKFWIKRNGLTTRDEIITLPMGFVS